jgi:hypothetical protein
MTMHTSARDEALLEEIARLFDIYAADCDALAACGYSKRDSTIRAKCWREAAEDVRSIRLDPVQP